MSVRQIFSGYPDCRDEFVKSMKNTIYLATEMPIEIHAPLMNLDKAETWKLAKRSWMSRDYN